MARRKRVDEEMRLKWPLIVLFGAIIVMSLVLVSISLSGIPPGVSSRPLLGRDTIKVKDISFYGRSATVSIVLDEETGSNDFKDRSTNWIIVSELDGKLAYPIIVGRADPDWKLTGTNDVTIWHWQLEKEVALPLESNFLPGEAFPFEVLTIKLYLATNGTRSFSGSSEVPNFSASVVQRDLNIDKVGMSASNYLEASDCPIFFELDLYVFHDIEYRIIVSALYTLILVIAEIAVVLFWKMKKVPSANFLAVSSGILLFLPLFFFTFRETFAPPYLTLFEGSCFALMLIYGVLLLSKMIFPGNTNSRSRLRPKSKAQTGGP